MPVGCTNPVPELGTTKYAKSCWKRSCQTTSPTLLSCADLSSCYTGEFCHQALHPASLAQNRFFRATEHFRLRFKSDLVIRCQQ